MTRNLSPLCLLLLAGTLGARLVLADAAPSVLGWPDLMPPMAAYDDPFLALTSTQLAKLAQVARLRERQQRAGPLPKDAAAHLTELVQSLERQGLDVDGLLARREDIRQKHRAAAEAVDPSLDTRRVRISGYLLPLALNGRSVTEFLLVPTVGACIHEPPPHPNQMVHVTFSDGFEAKGLYSPVWVEGTMAVGHGETELYLVDGAADVVFGYRIHASEVADYSE